MSLHICRNCLSLPNEKGHQDAGLLFEADAPVCPSCGIDGREVEYMNYVGKACHIHFDPPHPVLRNKGTGKTACDGRKFGTEENGHPVMMTGDRAAVTCPRCKASEVFKSGVKVDSVLNAKE